MISKLVEFFLEKVVSVEQKLFKMYLFHMILIALINLGFFSMLLGVILYFEVLKEKFINMDATVFFVITSVALLFSTLYFFIYSLRLKNRKSKNMGLHLIVKMIETLVLQNSAEAAKNFESCNVKNQSKDSNL